MNKKIVLIVIFVVILAIVGAWSLLRVEPGELLELITKKSPTEEKEGVTVGYGWSTKDDFKEAAREAVTNVLKAFKDEPPEYAILYSTAGYDSEGLLREVRQLLPDTKLHGGTSMLGVLTNEGFHIGKKGSLAILAVSSPKIVFGIGGADTEGSSAREAGKQAILAAMKDADKEGQLPKLIYMMGSFGNEEEMLLGIEEVVGENVPIVGGSSFDNDLSGNWRQFANDEIYVNGVVLTVFYTDLKISWAYEAGYEKTGRKGIITRAEGRTIYEIDNRPALEVYDEWTEGLVGEVSAGSEKEIITEMLKTSFYPLAKILSGAQGEFHYLVMLPAVWNMKDDSIEVGAKVYPGEEITLMHGSWEMNLNYCQVTPTRALEQGNIEKGEAYFVIYNSCLGKMLTLPEEERAKMPLLLNNALGGTPFIGTNSGGEQAFLSGVGNEHGNLVDNIIIFGPEE